MKLTSVYRKAWRVYCKHFKALMLTLLLELALRCIALTPLLFLAAPQIRFLALLCIPLWLLIVLPARQNTAEALQATLASDQSPFSAALISSDNYKIKLLRGLTATLRMLLWFIPLIAGVILALWATHGSMDGFTLYRLIRDVGSGNAIRGIQRILIGYLLTLIPPLLGCAFHCGTRHAAALGRPRMTRGHHLKLMLVWLSGLLTFAPFLIATAFTGSNYVRSVVDAVKGFFSTFRLDIPGPGPTLILVAVFAVVLLLPLIPLHSLLPAVYMNAAKADIGKAGTLHDAA